MYSGIAFVAYGKKFEKSADVFAVEILPPLQKLLREDVVTNPEF